MLSECLLSDRTAVGQPSHILHIWVMWPSHIFFRSRSTWITHNDCLLYHPCHHLGSSPKALGTHHLLSSLSFPQMPLTPGLLLLLLLLNHYRQINPAKIIKGFFGVSAGKESSCSARDMGSIPGSGRSPREGTGNPFQYFCLKNTMDRGGWWATVHVVARVRHFLVAKPPQGSRQWHPSPVHLTGKSHGRRCWLQSMRLPRVGQD